jgi:L-2,4-diaminobutyrate decarboxylase
MILNSENQNEASRLFQSSINLGINFKLSKKVAKQKFTLNSRKEILKPLCESGMPVEKIITEFEEKILPYCTNFSSNNFMGFPDAGNSVAALCGSVISDFMQQNLINQSFCAPSATFVEIAVIRWLRETVGYKNEIIDNIWDTGGIVTTGGTSSNAIAMLIARENKDKNTLTHGVRNPDQYKIIVPKGIGHYSVKSAQMWIGCGNNLIEVETENFKYNLNELKKTLLENKGNIMAVVAYAGDSRTMTNDNFSEIATLVKSIDDGIWLHADACHGFSLGFCEKLKNKIKGIEEFDSISTDPHKVMLTPYTVSVLMVRDPKKMKLITSLSDLIMKEEFAFGQVTPFFGSKSWMSLKLWFMMKSFGKSGLDDLITKRHELAKYLAKILEKDPEFIVINNVEINSVMFFYKGNLKEDPVLLNTLSKKIHKNMLDNGDYHLHQFSIPDSGYFKKNTELYPLRFMCGNPNTTKEDIDNLIEYVKIIGKNNQ